jgi:hypothetical protein
MGMFASPNEHLLLDYFHRNIDTAIHFYHYLADCPRANIRTFQAG